MRLLVELAPNVWQVPLLPRDGVNAYLIGALTSASGGDPVGDPVDDAAGNARGALVGDTAGSVIVDAGTPWSRRRLLAALEDRPLAAHVLTHAHPDHQGGSAAVCAARSIPLWCGARDRAAAERADFAAAWHGRRRHPLFRMARWLGGPGQRVTRTLREGDVVAGFEVIETPGHTPGHISLWRSADGVVILGDVASHRNPLSLSGGLREPTRLFTRDPQQNRRSIHKIAALRPRLVCFGHGPPLADGKRFVWWAEGL
jgi:hydroxyacylglutathione hydrolase